MRWTIWAALAAPLMMVACSGPTARDVITEYRPKMEELRAKLNSALSSTLPVPGEAAALAVVPADPKPTYELKDGSVAGNTAFLSVEELKDGGKPLYDLVLASDLAYALAWTGPNNPMAESRMDEEAGDMQRTFANAAATPYIVVYRTIAYDPAVARDDKTFDGGNVDFEAIVVKAADGAPLGGCRIQAEAATEISYSYKEGEDPKERLEAFAESTLWTDARTKLAACLKEKTGGAFSFG